MVEHRAMVRSGHDQEAPIVYRRVVYGDPDGQQVVVRVRIEGEVLMPFHRASSTTGLGVQLVTLESDLRANQRADEVEQQVRTHQFVVERMRGDRIVDSPHHRGMRSVAWFKI